MSSSVVSGGFEITSNHESAADMLAAVGPKDDAAGPRVTMDNGKPVEPADTETAKAAATLGKKGGEATAAKRVEATKVKPAEPEPEVKEPEPVAKDKKGDPRHDPTARVMESRREVREALEEASQERARRIQVSEELARLKYEREQAAKPAPRADPGKPHRDQFATEDEYFDARLAHERSSWEQEAETKRQIEDHEREIASHKDGLKATVDEFAESTPDFVERTFEIATQLVATFNIPPSEQTAKNWMADYMLKYPADAPALLLHLVEDWQAPKSPFQRIASLRSPHAVYTDLAKLSARLEPRPEAATTATSSRTQVSQAKPPVRPVTGSPHTADPDIHGDIDFDTFMSRQGRGASKR